LFKKDYFRHAQVGTLPAVYPVQQEQQQTWLLQQEQQSAEEQQQPEANAVREPSESSLGSFIQGRPAHNNNSRHPLEVQRARRGSRYKKNKNNNRSSERRAGKPARRFSVRPGRGRTGATC